MERRKTTNYTGGMDMNFKEFYENVEKMKYELQEQFINAEDVQITYTKFDGNDCIWAMVNDKIISYFKW